MTNAEFTHLEDLKEQLKAVPMEPGVYLWRDESERILYIGKAKQLKARMRQYVNLQDERPSIPALMAKTRSFDYLVAVSEHESLVLEKNLIDQFSPPFNVDFKDDKSYPFIALTLGDSFPAIKYTREKPQRNTRYFGPYTDARAARETMETARRIVPLCKTSCVEWKRLTKSLSGGADLKEAVLLARPCFDSHVGLGPGPCTGQCTPEEYQENVRKIVRFLSGHRREFISALKDDIEEAVSLLDFERAAREKKRLDTLMRLNDKQSVVLSPQLSADSIGFFREETITGVQVLSVREGVVLLRNEFILDKGLDVSDDELVRAFLLKYYEQASYTPRELILRTSPTDSELILDWLTRKLASKHGAKVRMITPQAGEKHELLKMAERNAKHVLSRYMVRTRYVEERVNQALLELESALALEQAPLRIECYDVSTFHGSCSVASLVVFEGGRPAKKEYRHFRIKKQEEAHDVAMMVEVIERRFSAKNLANKRFASMPSMLIVDGGKPQLNAVLQKLQELGIKGVAVVGLAKRDEELFVSWQSSPVLLPSGSMGLYLVKQVRDEAHRFAITYHRKLRNMSLTSTVLDSIAGLGPKRKRTLLKAFGSQKALKAASEEDITAVDGIPNELAKRVYSALH